MGLLLALAAVMAGPLAMPATATAAPLSVAMGVTAAPAPPSADSPSDTAFRTSGALAGTVIGTAALVGIWWYLVVRARRK